MARVLLKAGESAAPVEIQLEQSAHGDIEVYRYRRDNAAGELEVHRLGAGLGWIRLNGVVLPYYSLRQGDVVEVWMNGRSHRFQVADGAARRSSGTAARKERRSDRVSAPMPGTIRRIATRTGESFEAHQPLVIMESMKMELTLSVPHAGRVREITCREGQLVEMGALLVRVEAN